MCEQSELLKGAIDKINIYLKGQLVPKENILGAYAEFLGNNIIMDEKNTIIQSTLITPAFDSITLCIVGLTSYILNSRTCEENINSLAENDMVLYKGKRRRFIKRDIIEGREGIWLLEEEEDKKQNRNLKKFVYSDEYFEIQPYYGNSEYLDGRGIRDSTEKKVFLNEIFPRRHHILPSNVSVIVVMNRNEADYLVNEIELECIETGEKISFLDLFTASYFTKNREYPYAGNPSRHIPMLKIVSSLSIARQEIEDNADNKTLGIFLAGKKVIEHGESELDILKESQLRYSIFDFQDNYMLGYKYYSSESNAKGFISTLDFIKKFSCIDWMYQNNISRTLKEQMQNMLNGKLVTDIISIDFSHEEYDELLDVMKKLKNHFYEQGDYRNQFVNYCYLFLYILQNSLTNLQDYESMYNENKKRSAFNLIYTKMLDYTAELIGQAKDWSNITIELLSRLQLSVRSKSYKRDKIIDYIDCYSKQGLKIAVVVPSRLFISLTKNTIHNNQVDVITTEKINSQSFYDVYIFTGSMKLKHRYLLLKNTNILQHTTVKSVVFLLYDFEEEWLARQLKNFEKFKCTFDFICG